MAICSLIVKNAAKDITEYPVAELIVASGFFIVLSLEQIVMGVCVAKNENKKKNKKEHGHEHKNHDSGKTKTADFTNNGSPAMNMGITGALLTFNLSIL